MSQAALEAAGSSMASASENSSNLEEQYPMSNITGPQPIGNQQIQLPVQVPKCELSQYCVKKGVPTAGNHLISLTPTGNWTVGDVDPVTNFLGSNAGVSIWKRKVKRTFAAVQVWDILA